MTPPLLTDGTIVEVFGFVLLEKLDPGRYRVESFKYTPNQWAYGFYRPRGKKRIVVHSASDIDSTIRAGKRHPGNLNRIEIVRLG